MGFILTILFALSLCADCFAVTLCSSVSVRGISGGRILRIALVFGVVQAGLLALGWAFGDLFVSYIEKVSHIVGFLLLLYVGGGMVKEAFDKDSKSLNLSGLKNVLLGAVATSIDAFAAGISLSMDSGAGREIAGKTAAVFVCTVIASVAGMKGGQTLGRKFGSTAELVGGIVLIILGLLVLFGLM